MYPQSTPNRTSFDGKYVPYFYSAGLYLSHNITPTSGTDRTVSDARSSYDFSSIPTNLPSLDRPATVEQIVAHGYFAVPEAESTTALISDRKQISWLGLDDIISQIRRRHELYLQNVYELEQAQCSAVNAVFRVEADRGSLPATSDEQYSLQKRLQELYTEQRKERVELWRDTSRLKLLLPEAMQSYLSSYRKMSFLEDGFAGGGSP